MTYRLEMGHALAALRAAFDPLHCIVRLYDRGKRVRFHVYDPDHKRLYSALSVPVDALLNPVTLRAEIEHVRNSLEKKGWNFNEWTPPG
jgi:hypothetical protein